MKDSLKIAIAGATGYTGLQLIKILLNHPKVKISYLCAQKSIGKSISLFDNTIKAKKLPKISKISKIDWNTINVLFAALPNGEAQKIAKNIPKSVLLIDLSADFRLEDHKMYKKWYGIEHKAKHLIKESIYAISEFSKERIKNYRIISCPGCYPTSIQLPLIPLIKDGMINVKNIIVDSKSGFSGAGKKIEKKFTHKYLYESVTAYSVGSHRHMSEIDQELSKYSKNKIKISFTPHLIPMFRGILSTIYIESRKKDDARSIYKKLKLFHKNNFFVRIVEFNKPIGTGDVMGTNYCKISVCQNREKNKVIIISAIDNLIKGASGQAVQNMNLFKNFNENLGLK